MITANQRRHSIAIDEGILFTDMYQLTMAHLYFRMGMHEIPAQFDHFFRSYPNYGSHMAGYCIIAGLEWLVEWMEKVHFDEDALGYLRTLTGGSGRRLFEDDFLAWLKTNGTFGGISLQAVPEGRVVHPNVPLTVIQGPLAMAQILETALLNKLNYPTLIATKAARIRQAGKGNTVLEFGMRRGQASGVNAGARAAIIGGADFSSNTGLSARLGVQAKGTHAHSMVQAFIALGYGELEAFEAYADVYPDNCLLLVDTINTLQSGVPNAIKVFEKLRAKGHRPVGIRLDSGDLAHLSVQAACMLNEAGFPETSIVLSNSLDEMTILQIIAQIREEAPRKNLEAADVLNRLVYGVGTRLITSDGDAALDGVFKLVALQKEDGWRPAIKISENPIKTPNPGRKTPWRVYDDRGLATADLIAVDGEDVQTPESLYLHHPTAHGIARTLGRERISETEKLLQPILDEGQKVYDFPPLPDIQEQRERDLERLDIGVKRIIHPHIYHVSLTRKLWDLKQELISKHRR
ncbi:MAG: nicotinate phosphoribosyltransferase [Ardenticatenaceae bacterium]|nr:nicotinate phosphoribosyltransferase [Ardenticatenaceae bacterium]